MVMQGCDCAAGHSVDPATAVFALLAKALTRLRSWREPSHGLMLVRPDHGRVSRLRPVIVRL